MPYLMRRIVFVVFLVNIFTACHSTGPSKSIPIEKLLSSDEVIPLTYEQSENGLIYVTVVHADTTGRFVLDTGATRSAIFENSGVNDPENRKAVGIANIFGLVDTGTYPLVKAKNLRLGSLMLDELAFALLPTYKDRDASQIDGILGMDFLEQYRLMIRSDESRVYLIENSMVDPDITQMWIPVELFSNPFLESESRLHFFNLRVGSHVVPALLDTGSEINLIN